MKDGFGKYILILGIPIGVTLAGAGIGVLIGLLVNIPLTELLLSPILTIPFVLICSGGIFLNWGRIARRRY